MTNRGIFKGMRTGGRFIDITGQRFGRLTALRPVEERKGGSIAWECQCECGNTKIVSGSMLRRGTIKSCGCLKNEKASERGHNYLIDLTGQTFGRLTVLNREPNGTHGRPMWKCRCECGNIVVVSGAHLRTGDTKSCGCFAKDRVKEAHSTHGMSKTKLYNKWRKMIARCNDKAHKSYADYGGRGISVCKEWLPPDGFVRFAEWAAETGYKESEFIGEFTIERIDVNGNYSPSNCTWATAKEQANNRRSNKTLTYKGETKNISEWGEQLGIRPDTLFRRIQRGWSTRQIIETPLKKIKRGRGKVQKQNQLILEHLRNRGSITSAEAFHLYGISRISARIFDLRRAGYIIKSTMEEGRNKFGERTRYARYSLIEED